MLLAGSSRRKEESFKTTLGKVPTRRDVAELMEVDYDDKSRKQYLRKKIKQELLKYLDIMEKPFSDLDWVEELYPVIKKCQSMMLKEQQIEWTRNTIYHVIHFIYEDTRRNAGSKAKTDAIRKGKRELAVSFETSISTDAKTQLLPT